MPNLVPVVTLVLALSFGLEKARLKTAAVKVKVSGTLTGIGGAMLLTFYKGVEVDLWLTHVNLLHHAATTQQGQRGSSNRILGSLLAVASYFCCALWFIFQMGQDERGVPISLHEHRVDVLHGVNPSSALRVVQRGGFEPVAARMEHQVPYRIVLADLPPLAGCGFACGVVGDHYFLVVRCSSSMVRAGERTVVCVGF
ncbi:hypothetical protein NL676_039438 [Syzygium grande]|nr:hypothetical protein NL676_039438 [Syzygium grande]